MKRLLILGLIALVLTSCVIHVGSEPEPRLKYYNEALLYQLCDITELKVSTNTAEVELEGWSENIIEIVVGYREAETDDGIIYIENGAIKARSASGKNVEITKVKGKIPRSLSLDISNATGNVDISNLNKARQIDISIGSGNFSLPNCSVTDANIDIDSGNASLRNSMVTSLDLEVGSGNVTLTNSMVDDIDIEVGSGNVTLKDCVLSYGSVTTGSGNIILQNTTGDRVRYVVGSGEVIYLD